MATQRARKRSSTDVKARAKRVVRAVLVGAATGAIVGAIRGAAQAGSKEMGLRTAGQGEEDRAMRPPAGSGKKKAARTRRTKTA
jgi:hypothetical protein